MPESRLNPRSAYTVTHQKAAAFYDCYERKSELRHQTHYCPGCGHGIVHKLLAAGDRRAGDSGPHRAHQPGGLLGLRLLLFRCRQHSGGPRARARGRHGGQAQPPREHRDRLPGRWRPGGHRHRRDRPRRQPRRSHHGPVRQQRHLRHDRRPDGAHHSAGQEDHHIAVRPQFRDRRLPHPHVRAAELARRRRPISSAWPWATTSRSCRRRGRSSEPSKTR